MGLILPRCLKMCLRRDHWTKGWKCLLRHLLSLTRMCLTFCRNLNRHQGLKVSHKLIQPMNRVGMRMGTLITRMRLMSSNPFYSLPITPKMPF
jgi:hypothetical protein